MTLYTMSEQIPADIKKDIEKARSLHQRATSDHHKCVEFNKLMSDTLGRLEDAGCYRAADKVMSILIECNPKEGSCCGNAFRIGAKVKTL